MRSSLHKAQSGVVLIISLIVLVAMTLGALALIRAVDTNNLIAGNLAFQQAATHSADVGIEEASAWLNAASLATLTTDQDSQGYVANGSDPAMSPNSDPDGFSWDRYWNRYVRGGGNRGIKTLAMDAAGNTVSYIIDRLCPSAGALDQQTCVVSPTADAAAVQGQSASSSGGLIFPPHPFCYRITVRVEGPRNTVSYVQSIVYKS
jgi:Tfp pilus assembly protein PilX